jgi:hypothetical protein
VALKRLKNGTYTINSETDAKKALKLMEELADNIAELEKEHGIDEMRMDATELKKATTQFAIAKKLDEITLAPNHYYKLISAGYDRRWILDKSELTEAGLAGHNGVTTLRASIRRRLKKDDALDMFTEIWNRVTKRIADPDGIDEIVGEGIVSMDDIKGAFVEKARQPYLRGFKTNQP